MVGHVPTLPMLLLVDIGDLLSLLLDPLPLLSLSLHQSLVPALLSSPRLPALGDILLKILSESSHLALDPLGPLVQVLPGSSTATVEPVKILTEENLTVENVTDVHLQPSNLCCQSLHSIWGEVCSFPLSNIWPLVHYLSQ